MVVFFDELQAGTDVTSYLKFLLFLLKLSFSDTIDYRRWQGKETQLISQSFIQDMHTWHRSFTQDTIL